MTAAEARAADQDPAAARAEAARKRAGQLQERRAELAAGLPTDPESVEVAGDGTVEAHQDAAEVHRAEAAKHDGSRGRPRRR